MRRPRLLLSCAFVLLSAIPAAASSPVLGAVRPAGGTRGTDVVLTLAGARLGDAQEILWYQPGVETLGIATVDDNSFQATIRIAPEARLGLYDLRVRTATGLSHLRTFSVGAFPEVAEVEPNNDFEAPQEIPLGVTVAGVAENEDDDYFIIEASKGQRITAEVEGIRLGIALFDPYVAILDLDRFELARSDDAPLVRQDGIVQIIAPEDGRYIVQVRESAYQGNGNCLYRLHVGPYTRPRATLPSGGPLGETVEVHWIGDIEGDRTEAVTLPIEPDPTFGLFAEDDRGIAPDPNPFRLSTFGNVIEAEPNASHDEAAPFTPPMALEGVIGEDNDSDHFVFEAKAGQVFDVRTYARTLGSPLDAVVWVASKDGVMVGANDDNGSPDSYYRFSAPADGPYVVAIRDLLNKGGPTHTYRIEVTPVAPKLTLSPQNENPQLGVINAPVPRGNRLALLLNAGRADFGGDLAITAEGLPEGVAMEADTMTANIATMPVLFNASADAPIGGTLATLNGAHTDPNVAIPSEFSQTVELVQGVNNVPFWTRTVDRLAVSVAEEAPFAIEVVEPKVPVVRNGSMQLKVVATRAEGFNAPIAVSLPWNPPGVGSAGGVSIPEGQNEALIPLNANDNAPLQTWKVVVNGYADGPTGPVVVSSQLAPLTVAEKFLTLDFQRASAEQGSEAPLLVKVNKLTDFEGEATATLIGLPNAATAEPQAITKDTAEILFPIKVAAETPEGTHKNLFCQVVVTQNGEPILHNLGSTELRVDTPLPKEGPKPDEAAAAAAPEPPAEVPAKPLSPLEKLRLEQQERNKAEQQSDGDAPK